MVQTNNLRKFVGKEKSDRAVAGRSGVKRYF